MVEIVLRLSGSAVKVEPIIMVRVGAPVPVGEPPGIDTNEVTILSAPGKPNLSSGPPSDTDSCHAIEQKPKYEKKKWINPRASKI